MLFLVLTRHFLVKILPFFTDSWAVGILSDIFVFFFLLNHNKIIIKIYNVCYIVCTILAYLISTFFFSFLFPLLLHMLFLVLTVLHHLNTTFSPLFFSFFLLPLLLQI
jgi:hypothetical protein